MLNIHKFVFNSYGENTYVMASGKTAVVVDPGCESPDEKEGFLDWLDSRGLKPSAILLTHAHNDHIAGVQALMERYPVPVYLGAADAEFFRVPFATVPVSDGQKLELEGLSFEVISTPGHTPGGACYYARAEKVLLTGDTLFRGTIGRTDLPGGDYDKLIVSVMEKLMGLDGDVAILPGHGPVSTIADERTENPFLQPFNEPGEEQWLG